METSQQIFSQKKRVQKSEDVRIQFTVETEKFCYYNVIKTEKLFREDYIAYLGRITKNPSEAEYCGCGDFLNRSTQNFKNEHGHVLQCKHMMQAKKIRGWN